MTERRLVDFDPEAVRGALRSAVVDAWAQISSLDPPERTYGLMFYEGAEYGYVCVTAFTEEGLDSVTEQYRAGDWADEYQGDLGREGLRWSAPDSPYHVLTEIGCPPLVPNDTQQELWERWDDDDAPIHAYVAHIRSLCIETLQALDGDGLFEPDRDQLTLMLLSRDEVESDEDLHSIVRQLNPPAVVERYVAWRRLMT